MGSGGAPRRQALLADSRYELLVKIATGGQATVYVGRVSGSEGFSRLVAIKRAHPYLREDPKARSMLIREARLASRIHHANVVPIVDVEESDDELLLVMDYIEGGALSELLERELSARTSLPHTIALRILLDACAGLCAVHDLAADDGRPLGLVHRDVSPQNILVGVDGTARMTDFGLAQVTEVSASASTTVRGKLAYLAPEYIEGARFTQQCDVFSMGVVIWETLAGRRLFRGSNDANTIQRVLSEQAPLLSTVAPDLGALFDDVVARALEKTPQARCPSMDELSRLLATAADERLGRASHAEVSHYVRDALAAELAHRRTVIAATTDPERAITASIALDSLPIELPPLPAPQTEPPADPGLTRIELPRASQPLQPEAQAPPAPRTGGRGWLLVAAALFVAFIASLIVAPVDVEDGDAPTAAPQETAASPAPEASSGTSTENATTANETHSAAAAPGGSASAVAAESATAAPTTSVARPPRQPVTTRPTTTEPAIPDNPYKRREGEP